MNNDDGNSGRKNCDNCSSGVEWWAILGKNLGQVHLRGRRKCNPENAINVANWEVCATALCTKMQKILSSLFASSFSERHQNKNLEREKVKQKQVLRLLQIAPIERARLLWGLDLYLCLCFCLYLCLLLYLYLYEVRGGQTAPIKNRFALGTRQQDLPLKIHASTFYCTDNSFSVIRFLNLAETIFCHG